MAAPTPGPWAVARGGQDYIFEDVRYRDRWPYVTATKDGDYVGFPLARVESPKDGRKPDAEAWANATLMAAAPDLLAACEGVLAWLDVPAGFENELAHGIADARRALAEAIAKAKGGDR